VHPHTQETIVSDHTLRRFLQRVNGDAAFRDSVLGDPAGAIAALGLSQADLGILATTGEDALRRLADTEVAGYARPRPPKTNDSQCKSYCVNCIA
jgi:hypothetical protein